MDLFVKPVDAYKRDIKIVPAYIEQMALGLSKLRNIPYDDAVAFVKKQTKPGGPQGMRMPMTQTLERGKNGDKKLVQMPLMGFLERVVEKKEILSPSLTAYTPSAVKKSLPAIYIDRNVKKRGVYKNAELDSKMQGDHVGEQINNAQQTTYKYKNNALSGAHRAPTTGLVNKSAHSTLTSGCRCATSYGNANNEKFITGNRHYWCVDVVTANILATCRTMDRAAIIQAMNDTGFVYPTVEDTMKCILRSTQLYFRSDRQLDQVRQLVKALDDVERAAFVYTGDLYHIDLLNHDWVENFFLEALTWVDQPEADIATWTKKTDGDLRGFVSLIRTDLMKGMGYKDFAEKDPEGLGYFVATSRRVYESIEKRASFIKAFFVTDIMPPTVNNFPASQRRAVITSDTDSTIFTVQYWTRRARASAKLKDHSDAVSYFMVYLASQTIRHILAMLSSNMGVEKEFLFRLQMKNEFFFPVFVPTSRAKHYYAYVAAREGNVYPELDTEVKGVALRSSKVPVYYNKLVVTQMKRIMDAALKGETISILDVLRDFGLEEKKISDDIKGGNPSRLTRESVKSKDAYKNPQSSNFIYYGLWEQVFAPKYGHAEEPPYKAVKVALNLKSKTKLAAWLERIEDKTVALRLNDWLTAANRNDLTMLLMPESIITEIGVPPEATCGIDDRQLIMTTMEAFYIVLESLGLYFKNKNNTHMVMDLPLLEAA